MAIGNSEMENKIIYRHLKPNGEVFYVGIGNPGRETRRRNKLIKKENGDREK